MAGLGNRAKQRDRAGSRHKERPSHATHSWPLRLCAFAWLIAVAGLWAVGLLVVGGCSGGHNPPALLPLSPTPSNGANSFPQASAQTGFVASTSGTRASKPTLLASAPKPERIQRSSSTLSLVQTGGRTLAYVADEDARAILTVDVDSGKELAKTHLGAAPSSVLTLPDGRVVISLQDANKLALLVPASSPALPLRVHSAVAVPTEPTAIAATPTSDRVYVVSRWGASFSDVRLPSANDAYVARTLKLSTDPFSAVLTRDGKSALVSHVTGGKVSRIDLTSWVANAEDHVRQTRTPQVANHIRHRRFVPEQRKMLFDVTFPGNHLPAMPVRSTRTVRRIIKRTPLHGFAILSVGDDLVVPVSEIFPGEKERITTGYGSSVTFEQPVQEGLLQVSSEVSERGGHKLSSLPRCRLPRAATHNDRDKTFVVCQGDSSVVSDGGWGSVEVGRGPTGIAWDARADRLVVWSQHARELSVIHETSAPSRKARSARTVARHAMPYVARDTLLTHGRELFFATDRRISSDGRSCASCHPGGRQDGLVWSTPNGPRQTPMLAGKLSGTAPFGWNGDAKSVEQHMAETFKRLGGKGLNDHDSTALAAYIKSLRVPQTRPAASRTERIAQGKAIFHSSEAACASCHVEKRSFSDTMTYSIVRAPADRQRDFNTPALVGLANTAPYFHDGRFPTLLAMLEGTDGKMGHSAHLSGGEKDALVAYLESL